MVQQNPLDIVVGAAEAERNAAEFQRAMDAAQAAEQAGDRLATIAHLRRALVADPGNVRAMFDLAYRLDLVGEEDEALALYEQVVKQSPAYVNALINLAVLYEDRGEYAQAERCLKQVLETNPNHPRARLYMKDVQAARETVTVEEDATRDAARRRALLDTPVTDCDLSVRVRTALRKMNIRTLGDLVRCNEAELTSSRNLSEEGLEEIRRLLAAKGLRIGQGAEETHRAARRHITDQLRGSGHEAVLNKPVTDIQFSVRVRKALQLLNVRTLGDLAALTEAELMGVKNFGATSLEEVKSRLAEHGLSLRTLKPPAS